MYTLAALLSLVVTGAYVRGVVEGRRRYLPLLVVSVDLLLYTHNWGLFLCVGLGVATICFARAHWREAAIAGFAILVLYTPWLPTLLYQVKHTGAPWAIAPGFYALVLAPASPFAADLSFGALALAAGAGLVTRKREAVPMALLVVVASTIVFAWSESQVSSSWTPRYFGVLLGPVLLPVVAGIARAGKLGLAAVAVALVVWSGYTLHDDKSNARAIAHGVAAYLHPGELVISTHPEQVPVLRYYLGPGFRYATQLGPVADPRVMDWRDVVSRIDASTISRDLEPELASVRPGERFAVVSPVFRDYHAWYAPWTRRVFLTSQLWTSTIAADPRFRKVATITSDEILLELNYWKPLQAVIYVRRR